MRVYLLRTRYRCEKYPGSHVAAVQRTSYVPWRKLAHNMYFCTKLSGMVRKKPISHRGGR